MSTELIETNASTAAALVPTSTSSIVRPAANIDEVLAVSTAYHELYARLLDSNDFQTIGTKKFVKKSGWRKLALAFNVTTELISRDYERNEAGRIVRAEVVARAGASNGRYADGLGAADLYEKCCAPNCHQRHTHCPAGNGALCEGTRHWSHPQHDIPATAATRATNRACSDLFGMGEVSAEEVDAVRDAAEADSVYDAKSRLDPWLQQAQLTQEELSALRAWRTEAQMPPPSHMGMDEVEATLFRIGMLVGARVALQVAAEDNRAAPRAATPEEAAADDAALFEGTASATVEVPEDGRPFDSGPMVPASPGEAGPLSGEAENDQQEMSWAEKDWEERTRPKDSPPTAAAGPSTPSGTDPSTTSPPAPATSEPLNFVQRGRAVQFHRKAGARGFQNDVQSAVILIASQGRTTHAAKITNEEMQVAESFLDQLEQHPGSVDQVLAAAKELADVMGPE